MICKNCGKTIEESAEFCPFCGTDLKQIQEQQNNQIPNIQTNVNENTNINISQQSNNNNENNKNNKIVPIILVVIIAIIAIYGVNKLMKKDTLPKSDENINDNVNQDTNMTYDKNADFLMAVDEVFTLYNSGTTVTGIIERGTINVNDEVQLIGLNDEIINTSIKEIEISGERVNSAEAGNTVALLLKDVSREKVERGQVVAKPNSIKGVSKFEAKIYKLTKEEGGEDQPILNAYRPQFYFRTTDVTGVIELLNNIKMINPGDTATVSIELTHIMAIEVGTKFNIRSRGQVIGRGTVTKIY